ncbi:hypothetical protein ATDW_28570 [Asticcacaulis sp. DW145]|nr:hypothetical protein ATDW_28570 [Asticcacaulis sp. DW145]
MQRLRAALSRVRFTDIGRYIRDGAAQQTGRLVL